MSRETEEFLSSRFGKGSFGGEGFDLSQTDRLQAGGQFLDKLFEQFTEWLMEQAGEPSSPEGEPIYGNDGQVIAYDVPLPDVEWPETNHDVPVSDVPTYTVESVGYWPIGQPTGIKHLYACDYDDISVNVTDGSVGISTTDKGGHDVRVMSLPRSLYIVTWHLVRK